MQLPEANGRITMKTPNCLRQMDETKCKCAIASGKNAFLNENIKLPKANGHFTMKTPNCLRQMGKSQ